MPIEKKNLKIPKNITLADPCFDKPSEIDALVGNEIFCKLLCLGQIYIENQQAILCKTHFGWILSGKITSLPMQTPRLCNISVEELDHNLTKFLELEEVASEKMLSPEEEECEKFFINTTTRNPETGRFIVRLPFNDRKNELGNSYFNAHKRKVHLEFL